MQNIHDESVTAVKVYVARAINDGARGTQTGLARHLRLPSATIHKWAKRIHCPAREQWPGIEEYFGWEPGTIAGVAGVVHHGVEDVEAAIMRDPYLDEEGRDLMLHTFRYFAARSRRDRRDSAR